MLRFALEQSGVELRSATSAKEIYRDDTGWAVVTDGETLHCDKLIDACVTKVTAEPGETDGSYVLHITVEAKATPSSGHYSVGTQEVRIGKELYLKTLDVEIIATVDRMEKLS